MPSGAVEVETEAEAEGMGAEEMGAEEMGAEEMEAITVVEAAAEVAPQGMPA